MENNETIYNISQISTTVIPNSMSIVNTLTLIYALILPPMMIILLIAIVGNGIIVLSAHKLTSPVSPYLRLCVSLAAADTWAASLMISGLFVNSVMPVLLKVRKTNMCFDAVLEIFRISGMLTSDMHLFALAINQFIGTMWPLKYKMIVTSRRLRLLVFLLWIVPFIFTGSWFFAFEGDGFRHPKCHFSFYNRFAPFRITIFTVFMLPLLATLIIYAIILNHLLKAKAEFKAVVTQNTSDYPRKSHVNSRLKLVWTTLLIVSTFSFSWGICVCYFLIVCKQDCPLIYLRDFGVYAGIFFGTSVNGLVILKLAANPFIYTLRIRAIHKSVQSFLGSRFFKKQRRTICYKEPSSMCQNSKLIPATAPLISSASYTICNDLQASRSTGSRMSIHS